LHHGVQKNHISKNTHSNNTHNGASNKER
jgi:hypothetical protein